MSKKKHLTKIDFDIGVGTIIPSTQEAFNGETFSVEVRKSEKNNLSDFKNTLGNDLDAKLKVGSQFSTEKEIFVFIVQYFVSKEKYSTRDVDNMAKTILDVLKGRFYKDDSQVKTLLIGKKIEQRIPQDFAYIAIKYLNNSQEVDALKISGLERSVTMFQELKSKNIL